MLTARVGLLAVVALFPRLGCGETADPKPDRDPYLAAPSASVVTIMAGIGFCEDLATCQKECDTGSSDRCRRLGVNYEFGHGVEIDGVKATALYEQACTMANPEGCVAAGRMHEFHHGVPKDDAKAVSFYRHACDLADDTGCVNLAIMLENGRGLAKDPAKAKTLFDEACKRGSSLACSHAKALVPPPLPSP